MHKPAQIFCVRWSLHGLSALLIVSLILFPSASIGHFGEIPPLMALPKTLEQPEKQLGQRAKPNNEAKEIVTRFEYVTFLRTIAELELPTDPLQRRFSARMEFVAGLSKIYSGDLADLSNEASSKTPNSTNTLSPTSQVFLSKWASTQAELLLYFKQVVGTSQNRHRQGADSNIVIEHAAISLKSQFLTELVGWGEMEPTVAGLKKYLESISAEKRLQLHQTIPEGGPKSSSENATRAAEMRRRVISYRKDLLKIINYQRNLDYTSLKELNDETVLGSFDNQNFTFRQWKAVFGPVENDAHWNALKAPTIGQWVVGSAMAKQADSLGVLPLDLRRKIAMLELLYQASEEILSKLPEANNPSDNGLEMSLVALARTPGKLRELSEKLAKSPEIQEVDLDSQYINSIEWLLLTPESTALPDYF